MVSFSISGATVTVVCGTFFSDDTLPASTIRAHRDTIEEMLATGEGFVISNFDGFPEQLLDKALFNMLKE